METSTQKVLLLIKFIRLVLYSVFMPPLRVRLFVRPNILNFVTKVEKWGHLSPMDTFLDFNKFIKTRCNKYVFKLAIFSNNIRNVFTNVHAMFTIHLSPFLSRL